MYSKNRRGPRFDPRGTPQFTFCGDDVALLTTQNYFLLCKYDLNQFRELFLISYK